MSDSLVSLTRALHHQKGEIDALVKMVAGSDDAVKLLVDGLTFAVEIYRFNCSRVISKVAETSPRVVYPHWERIEKLLDSSNTYHRCAAINILPHLIPADGGAKFERIFGKFFSKLDDASVIPPCYVARNCPVIASHRPDLVGRIVTELLSIDATHHQQGRKDLIKADIILALDQLYDRVENSSDVLHFVEVQSNCSSPKTRKAAKSFLEKRGLT